MRENESKLETSRGGVRHATSTGGVGTGERVHRVIHDDLLRSNDAHSEAKRKQAEEHCKAMSTRGADPLTFTQVMIMQRLHERDPAAWAKARGWEVLSLPAEYEPSKTKTTSIGWKDPRVSDGELLWPNHFPQAVIDAAKLDLGSYAYAAQFQQSPSPLGGGIIRGEWFKRYAVLPPLKQLRIYADTAQKTQERHDYSVFQCWGQCADGKLYLVDQIRGKWESHELKRRAIDFWHKHIASTVPLRHMKIEDKASGTGLIQDLRHEGKIPVSGIGRTKDKLTRVLDVVSRIEAGFVYLPENSAFVSDFIHECEAFTNDDTHLHDDQIDPLCDAISDMLIFKQVTKISTLKI